MKNHWTHAIVTSTLVSSAFLSGCTQMPTERQGVADIRPQISFRYEQPEIAQARVNINGIELGQAGSYRAGTASLTLIPGTHQLRITLGDRLILDERFYVADGVNKTFNLK